MGSGLVTTLARPFSPMLPIRPRSIVAGVVGAAGLLGLYLGIISLAQGAEHAFDQLAADFGFVSLIAAGFGSQIALFVGARASTVDTGRQQPVTAAGPERVPRRCSPAAPTALVDLLPLVGLSAAAVFLNAYRTPLFLVGIGMNPDRHRPDRPPARPRRGVLGCRCRAVAD
jgi:hypothetical protein